MAEGPLRICATPGCGRLSRSARCPEHTRGPGAGGAGGESPTTTPGKTGDPFYARAAWRRLRLVMLARQPLCQDCAARGLVEPATDVDHIEPRLERPDLALEAANLRCLCHACHSRRTIKATHRRRALAKRQNRPRVRRYGR